MRDEKDFYCYLGEAFFGYAGYAGQDLDGCYEMLQTRSAKRKITITVNDEDKVKAFLAEVSGHSEYYDDFKKMIEDLGGEVIAFS